MTNTQQIESGVAETPISLNVDRILVDAAVANTRKYASATIERNDDHESVESARLALSQTETLLASLAKTQGDAFALSVDDTETLLKAVAVARTLSARDDDMPQAERYHALGGRVTTQAASVEPGFIIFGGLMLGFDPQ